MSMGGLTPSPGQWTGYNHCSIFNIIIMPRNHISVMLGLGWSFFLLGWVLNLAYYSLHPNMVDTDPSRRMGRLYTRPLGWCGAGQGVLNSI